MKRYFVVALLLLLSSLLACSGGSSTKSPPPAPADFSVSVTNATPINIPVGGTISLSVAIKALRGKIAVQQPLPRLRLSMAELIA
jgi:hypothetical protein